MQNLPTLLTASLLAFGLGAAGNRLAAPQELQDTDDEKPYVSPAAQRQAKLLEGLEGTWRLTDYQTPDKIFEDDEALKGFVMFQDGHLAWTLYGSEVVPALFGDEREFNLEAVLYRYRVNLLGQLQMASQLGFRDLQGSGGLEFDDGHNAQDYELFLTEKELTLTNPGIESFHFRRMPPPVFPRLAIQALETQQDFDSSDPDEGR